MSEFDIEGTKAMAKDMGEQEIKVFLTQVDRKLLIGELDRRLENAEKKDNALKDLAAEN